MGRIQPYIVAGLVTLNAPTEEFIDKTHDLRFSYEEGTAAIKSLIQVALTPPTSATSGKQEGQPISVYDGLSADKINLMAQTITNAFEQAAASFLDEEEGEQTVGVPPVTQMTPHGGRTHGRAIEVARRSLGCRPRYAAGGRPLVAGLFA
jgi:hypothetical protein